MDYDRIKELLAKYYEGQTDLSDEKELKDFFVQGINIPPDFQQDKSLFTYFQAQRYSLILNEDLTSGVRKQWDKSTKTFERKISVFKKVLKYAAIILIVSVIGYLLMPTQKAPTVADAEADTFNDPEKAMIETQKALMLLSRNMSDGMAKFETIKGFNALSKMDKLK